MISPVRCSACRNDIRVPCGSFVLLVKAESTEDCSQCHQLIPRMDVAWNFCSVKCFTRLQPCDKCEGRGYTLMPVDGRVAMDSRRCGVCKGVGLSIAL